VSPLRLTAEQTSETKSIQAVPTILLILVAGIGDFVLATRAIRAVRRGHPGAAIHLLTSSEGAVFARRYSGIDQVFVFPIRELRGWRLPVGAFARLLRQLRRTRYDIAANLYPVGSMAGSARMALLFGLLRARVKAGHSSGLMRLCLNTRIPTRIFAETHRANAMARVATAIGGQDGDLGIEVPVEDGQRRWERLVAPHFQGHAGKLIGINPGGDRANRRWSAANFAAVASELVGRIGARVLIFGGPGEESAAVDIHRPLKEAAVNLAGRLELHELPYFLNRCDLLITNDSGPMHIAAALQVPVVALFGPEDPTLFGPCLPPEQSRVLQKPVPCRPCPHASCAQPICLQGIHPSEVLTASLDLLKTASSMNAADRHLKAG
jgi:lipopolysaccharide heptosyltransferase II